MKNKTIILLVISICIIFTSMGCSKYEKDESYNTDLYGTYSKNLQGVYGDSESNTYINNEKYIFNKDNTYEYSIYEAFDEEVTKDMNKSGKIISIEEISNDITKITLDQEIEDWSTGETSYKIIYKYKNMIGDFSEIDVPQGKTFEWHLSDYIWYGKDGQYHVLCDGSSNCDCSNSYPKYVRKDNIIYFQSMDEEYKDYYTIGLYIVENGIFTANLYKTEE